MTLKNMKWNVRSKTYTTLVSADHNLSGNSYVLGKISGIAEMMFGGRKMSCWHSYGADDARYFTVYTSPGKYELFQKKIEEFYPGLCVFDVTLDPIKEMHI